MPRAFGSRCAWTMLFPNRVRLALPLVLAAQTLPPLDVRTPPSDAKTVLFIRHGQSEANAAGLLGRNYRDAQLTDRGRDPICGLDVATSVASSQACGGGHRDRDGNFIRRGASWG